jgi:2-dehydro-3-deoxyphosphogluconate aldolase/(4S)-4-hydroxy-2-oxoglutarate aldolase
MDAMTRAAIRARIVDVGIIPSIRTTSEEDAYFAADTVARAGIPIVEVTMTVPNALEVIAHLARTMPALVVGAGTIFDVQTARRCVEAGARFLTSPGLDLKIVDFALKEGVVAVPGALTPSEVTAAWQSGADLIKIFPCAQIGGPSYLQALKAPFPDVGFVAAGGVNQQTAAEFIAAGAAAIGVGRELIPKKSIQHRDAHWITELARRFLSLVRESRSQVITRDESSDRR